MKLPASPNFTKFLHSVSENEQRIYLDNFLAFLSEMKAVSSSIQVFPSGEYIYKPLGSMEVHCFKIERYERQERWQIIFFDTAIPHARIEMSDCYPPLKKNYSLGIEYTELLIRNSLADIAEGFDDSSKPFIQKFLSFTPESWFATVGKPWWVYLRLKMWAIPELYEQFFRKVEPKLSFLEFGNYLGKQSFFNYQSLETISMRKKSLKAFLQENDSWILSNLNREDIKEWLSKLNMEFNIWFNAVSYKYNYR